MRSASLELDQLHFRAGRSNARDFLEQLVAFLFAPATPSLICINSIDFLPLGQRALLNSVPLVSSEMTSPKLVSALPMFGKIALDFTIRKASAKSGGVLLNSVCTPCSNAGVRKSAFCVSVDWRKP